VASTRGSRAYGEVEGKEQICYRAKFGILTWSRDTESECKMLGALFWEGLPCQQGECHQEFHQWSHCALRVLGPCSVGRVFCVSSAMLVTRGGGDIGAGSRAPLLCEKDWIFSGAPPELLAWCGGLEGWMPPFAVTSRERRFCSTGNSLIASPDLVVARTAVLALLSEMLTQANGTCRSGAMR